MLKKGKQRKSHKKSPECYKKGKQRKSHKKSQECYKKGKQRKSHKKAEIANNKSKQEKTNLREKSDGVRRYTCLTGNLVVGMGSRIVVGLGPVLKVL
jgi:hypothetical protein